VIFVSFVVKFKTGVTTKSTKNTKTWFRVAHVVNQVAHLPAAGLLLKRDLENRKPMAGAPSRKVLELIRQLEAEGAT